jgi:ATP-dependent Clp endopeptidase proteolytic subunit ClpP
MQHQRDYSFALGKKKPSKKQKPSKEIEEVSEDDPFEQLTSMFKPQSSMEREKNHIYFYQAVDQDSCLELNRKINSLNKDLMQHAIEYETEPPNIYLHINSFGGSLFAAFSTIDTIINSKIPIVSIIEGCAASAATIISMVCHKRYCTPNSFMLIHQLSTGASGKYEEMKDDFMNDTKLMELLYKLYLEHTNMGTKTIKKVLKRDLWWDAAECMKHGLIDELWNGSRISLNVNKEFGSEHFSTKSVMESRKRKQELLVKNEQEVSDSDSDSSDSDDGDKVEVIETKVSKSKRSKPVKESKPDKESEPVKESKPSKRSKPVKSTKSSKSKQVETEADSSDESDNSGPKAPPTKRSKR